MVSEHGHWRVARIAIEDCKFERVNEIGVALRVITQLAQFAFRHRAKVSVGSRSSRRIASHGGSRCVANVNPTSEKQPPRALPSQAKEHSLRAVHYPPWTAA